MKIGRMRHRDKSWIKNGEILSLAKGYLSILIRFLFLDSHRCSGIYSIFNFLTATFVVLCILHKSRDKFTFFKNVNCTQKNVNFNMKHYIK